MSKLQFVKLSDIFELQMGKTPSRNCKNYWDNGIYNWVSIADIGKTTKYIYETKEKITENAVLESGIKLVPKGTIIMSFKLSLGKTCITGKDIYTNEAIMAFLDKHIYSIDKNYIYHLFSNYNWEQNTNKAVKGITLNKATLSKIKIPLPPLEEQHKIASILDTVSEALKLRKQQLNELNLLVKSKFIDMFGDPIKNPKNLKLGIIRDICSEVKYGTSKPATNGGKYPYLRMNNITYDGHLDLSNLKYIDISESEVEKYLVKNGDVLFNRTNSKELVGKTCVFNLNKPMIIAGYLIRIRVNSNVLPIYLSCVLNSDYGKTTLLGMCKSIIGQANINAQELQNIKILIPPIELQNKFASFVQHVDELKSEVQKSIDQLQTLFDSLMQQYFE